MIKKDELKIPPEEVRVPISGNLRQKLFTEIYKTYSKLYGVKLIYAFMNTDPNLIIDYIVIYKTRNDDDTTDLIIFDASIVYGSTCTPAYRYCRLNKKAKKFYQNGIENMVTMQKSKFYEFIQEGLGLTLDKESPLYWKNPENYELLCEGLLDLATRYRKRE